MENRIKVVKNEVFEALISLDSILSDRLSEYEDYEGDDEVICNILDELTEIHSDVLFSIDKLDRL